MLEQLDQMETPVRLVSKGSLAKREVKEMLDPRVCRVQLASEDPKDRRVKLDKPVSRVRRVPRELRDPKVKKVRQVAWVAVDRTVKSVLLECGVQRDSLAQLELPEHRDRPEQPVDPVSKVLSVS